MSSRYPEAKVLVNLEYSASFIIYILYNWYKQIRKWRYHFGLIPQGNRPIFFWEPFSNARFTVECQFWFLETHWERQTLNFHILYGLLQTFRQHSLLFHSSELGFQADLLQPFSSFSTTQFFLFPFRCSALVFFLIYSLPLTRIRSSLTPIAFDQMFTLDNLHSYVLILGSYFQFLFEDLSIRRSSSAFHISAQLSPFLCS